MGASAGRGRKRLDAMPEPTPVLEPPDRMPALPERSNLQEGNNCPANSASTTRCDHSSCRTKASKSAAKTNFSQSPACSGIPDIQLASIYRSTHEYSLAPDGLPLRDTFRV